MSRVVFTQDLSDGRFVASPPHHAALLCSSGQRAEVLSWSKDQPEFGSFGRFITSFKDFKPMQQNCC